MSKKTRYTLKIQFMNHPSGSIVEHDPEWNEWTIDKYTYNYRGSIVEGEIAMLLDSMVTRKLTSLLEPVA